MINEKLAEERGISKGDQILIKGFHINRDHIRLASENTDDPVLQRALYMAYMSNEMVLQELWGFGADPNYIRFWEFPGCTCPKMDNEDRYGTDYEVYSDNCPIHGEG